MVKAWVMIEDGSIVLAKCFERSYCRDLEREGYLADGVLDGLEACYQCILGNISLGGSVGWDCVLSIISSTGIWLPLFIVYHDLRRRGRRPRLGVRDNTLWVPVGGGRLEVLVVEEGSLFSFERLGVWSRSASRDGFIPIIAIVDRVGGVTYYEARVVESFT